VGAARWLISYTPDEDEDDLQSVSSIVKPPSHKKTNAKAGLRSLRDLRKWTLYLFTNRRHPARWKID
jgi:hypothetical protein